MIIEGEVLKFHKGNVPEQNFELTINLKNPLTKEQADKYVGKLKEDAK
jgi:ribosomal protein L35AE/L33A